MTSLQWRIKRLKDMIRWMRRDDEIRRAYESRLEQLEKLEALQHD